MFMCVYMAFYELWVLRIGYTQGQTDPYSGLIEVLRVPLETIRRDESAWWVEAVKIWEKQEQIL